MKTQIITYFVLSLSLISMASADDKNAVVYEVSKAGKNKEELIRTFEKIQKLEAGNSAKAQNYSVFQRLDSKKFLVYKMEWSGGSISSSLGSVGGGGGSASYGSYVPDRSKLYCIITKEDKNTVDGEELEKILTIESEEIYEYTAAIGAKQSVRVLKEIKDTELKLMTQEEFVQRLKGGETWTLRRHEEKKCNPCFGAGKLGSLQGGGTCKECKGKGIISNDVLVKW